MSVLRSLHIRDFKSILNQTLALGRLNVFIGTNGAGKSNLLEALGMLSMAMEGRIDYQGMAARGMRLSTPEVFKSAFRNKRRNASFHVEGRCDVLSYSGDISARGGETEEDAWGFHAESLKKIPDTKKNSLAGRSNLLATVSGVPGFSKREIKRNQGIIPLARSFGHLPEDVDQTIEALKRYAIFAPSTPILRGVAQDPSLKSPLGLYGGGLATTLQKWRRDALQHPDIRQNRRGFIDSFFDLLEWAESLAVVKPAQELQSSHVHAGPVVVAFRDRFMSRNFKNLYAYDVSEGALFLLFVLTLVLHPETPPLLALDNVDSALNPGMVRNLIFRMGDILRDHPERQLFLTTHNPSALDGVDLFNPDHRLFVVKRDKQDGSTVFQRIAPPEGMTRMEWQEQHGALRLSEIWLSGTLGGLTRPEGF